MNLKSGNGVTRNAQRVTSILSSLPLTAWLIAHCAVSAVARPAVTHVPLSGDDVSVTPVASITVTDEDANAPAMEEAARRRAVELGASVIFLDPQTESTPKTMHFIAGRTTYKGKAVTIDVPPEKPAAVVNEVTSGFQKFFSNLKRWTPVKLTTKDGKVITAMYAGLSPDMSAPKVLLRDPEARAFKQTGVPTADIAKVEVLDKLPPAPAKP
jgi:hypothetical protein